MGRRPPPLPPPPSTQIRHAKESLGPGGKCGKHRPAVGLHGEDVRLGSGRGRGGGASETHAWVGRWALREREEGNKKWLLWSTLGRLTTVSQWARAGRLGWWVPQPEHVHVENSLDFGYHSVREPQTRTDCFHWCCRVPSFHTESQGIRHVTGNSVNNTIANKQVMRRYYYFTSTRTSETSHYGGLKHKTIRKVSIQRTPYH
ncbi:hypothetical protein EDB86DRAFT_2879804 [Lactarius hatsudake]|nr:hypothetical protein EDB86DRAFT_2879804 [Lactarius hatsudake]